MVCRRCLPVDDAKLLKESKIRDHLEAMVKLLREEDETGGAEQGDRTSNPERAERRVRKGAAEPVHPCLEYLLEHRVLEILCALGLADVSSVLEDPIAAPVRAAPGAPPPPLPPALWSTHRSAVFDPTSSLSPTLSCFTHAPRGR